MSAGIDSKTCIGTLTAMSLYHASCIAIDGQAVLIRGPSGSGKSALALRMIDRGADLVADDQCEIWVEREQLWARAPENLSGLLEVRGLGIIRIAAMAKAPVRLVADMKDADDIDRLPAQQHIDLEGIRCAWLAVDPNTPQADAVLRIALQTATTDEVELTR